MHLGISTALFFFNDLCEKLPAFRDAGFRRLEICPGSPKDGKVPHYDARDAAATEQVRARLATLGLEALSLHAPYSPDWDPAHPDERRRAETLDAVVAAARALKTLGGHTLVLHIAVNEFPLRDRAEREKRLDNVRRWLPSLVEALRPMGIRLALENLLPHLLGGDAETLMELLSPYRPEDVGICFDTSHANLWGERVPVVGMLERCLPRTINLHLSDNRGRFDDHFIPGEGNVDWSRLRRTLEGARYDGLVTLEVFKSADVARPEEIAQAAFRKAEEILNG
jgi:sugar phosphate isomerase/epimerase